MTVSDMIRQNEEMLDGQFHCRLEKRNNRQVNKDCQMRSPLKFISRKTPSPKLGSINEHFETKVQNEMVHPNTVYAGAKFSEPPSPTVLPKPPTHWTQRCATNSLPFCNDMAFQLKTILKVPVEA